MTLDELVQDGARWELEPSELRDLLEGREQAPFLLVDCREEDEHAAWRIGGEVLMPLSDFPSQVAQRLTIPEEPFSSPTPIVVYCHLGMRSLQAVQFLRVKGFEKAYSLRGGIEAWGALSSES